MKILITLVLFAFLITQNSHAFEACEEIAGESFTTIHELADDVLTATDKLPSTQSVLKVTATKFYKNQGNGAVSVLTDGDGNIAGIKVDFRLSGKKNEVMFKTFEELDKDEKLEYTEYNAPKPALVVKKAYGAKIYPSTGGEFTFSILTKKPNTYKHQSVFLRKVNNKWIVRNKSGENLDSVDLTPNVSGLEWNGTFSDASFE